MKLSIPVLAVVTAVALAACGASTGPLGTLTPLSPSAEPSRPSASSDASPVPGSPSSSPSSSPVADPATPEPADTMIVRAYFHLGGDTGSAGPVAVLREVPETQGVAAAAMRELLDGPTEAERGASPSISTAIPAGTRLLGLSIAERVATVDLSGEFEAGGGSASAIGRLAQVVFTLTQFPTVDSVTFRVDGREVSVFGSEGIVLDRPQARADYEPLLPAIWVDRPAWGAALGNPARITGSANVFEAAFMITILDGSGEPLAEQPAMATSGSGTRGTFDVTVPYEIGEAGWGTLRVWAASARDGTAENVREYPVWLTPND